VKVDTDLSPDDVLYMSPAPGSRTSPVGYIPHIALKPRCFPWTGRNRDKLALLVLTAQDEGAGSSGLFEFNGATLLIDSKHYDEIRPRDEEFPLLCHARQVDANNPSAEGDDDGTYSVVLANRLPIPGVESYACLVRHNADNAAHGKRPLSCLFRWRFTAGAGGEFESYMNGLGVAMIGDQSGVPGYARMPFSSTYPLSPSPNLAADYAAADDLGRLLTLGNRTALADLLTHRQGASIVGTTSALQQALPAGQIGVGGLPTLKPSSFHDWGPQIRILAVVDERLTRANAHRLVADPTGARGVAAVEGLVAELGGVPRDFAVKQQHPLTPLAFTISKEGA
jgi:hypothetical protein